MKNFYKLSYSSIVAGMLIGIAGIAFLQVGGIYGSILFSLGLLLVVIQNLTLFTGRIGYADSFKSLLKLCFCVLPINVLGAAFIGTLYSLTYDNAAILELISKKIDLSIAEIFNRGIFCGFMMVCAVESMKKSRVIGLIFSVSLFVLCGFEHSIADTFYVFASGVFSVETVFLILVSAAGNALGSLFLVNLLKGSQGTLE